MESNLSALQPRPTGSFIGLDTLASHLAPADVCLDLAATDKFELFAAIGHHMDAEHGLRADWVTQSLERREQVGSTGLGDCVAVPHARIRGLDRVLVAYVRLAPPISYDAPDGKPVSDVLVLLVPSPAVDEHLVLLAEAAQALSDPRFRAALRACTTREEVVRLFRDWQNVTHGGRA